MLRRLLLVSGLAWVPLTSRGQRIRNAADLLRVGADISLVDSGLARALQQGFGRDTGIGVQVVRTPALPLLDALAAGEFDVGLVNAPEAEMALDKQGLVHDRHAIAAGEFILVGPRARGRGPGRSAATAPGIAAALARIRDGALVDPAAIVFLSANDGSGAHLAEQAAWRLAGIAPQPPWYQAATADGSCIAQARAKGAHAIVERGAWNAQGGAPLAVLADGDAEMIEQVHAMRSFRSPHPAGKLFMAWISGAHGRAVARSHRGYRAPT